MSFFDQLSLVLEEPAGQNPLESAMEIVRKLDSVKQEVLDLQHQLGSLKQVMNGDLALGVRRHMPGLNVGVDPMGCKIGYRSKNLVFDPDIEKGIWIVTGDDDRFTKRFSKMFGPRTRLVPDIGDMVEAIVGHFGGHYKTLGEEIIGTGVVFVEGKRTTLAGLAQWRNTPVLPRKRLNTRLTEQVLTPVEVELRNLEELDYDFDSYEISRVPLTRLRVTEEGEKFPNYFGAYKNEAKMPPIAVVPNNGYFEIVDGNRRFRSAQKAQVDTLLVMILHGFSYWKSP